MFIRSEAVKKRKKGDKIKIDLKRKREKILPGDKEKNAEAKMDGTPTDGVETDDPLYWEDFLWMPERIKFISKELPKLRAEISQLNAMFNPSQKLNNSPFPDFSVPSYIG